MADTGTPTQVFTNDGALLTTITGVTQGSTSPAFTLHNFMFSGGVVSGTFGGATVTPQGANDSVPTWEDIGAPITAAQGFTLTPGQSFWGIYRFNVVGGDGTTSLTFTVRAVTPR